MSPEEKYYHPGITERTPTLDYPAHHNRHAVIEGQLVDAELALPPAPDWRYEPPVPSTAPRTEAFVRWAIMHWLAVTLALWAVIVAAWATALWLWIWG